MQRFSHKNSHIFQNVDDRKQIISSLNIHETTTNLCRIDSKENTFINGKT